MKGVYPAFLSLEKEGSMTPISETTGTTSPLNRESPAAPRQPNGFGPPNWGVPPECVPNVDDIIIEDDIPVDNIFSEKEMRL